MPPPIAHPSVEPDGEITRLLLAWQGGDAQAFEQLVGRMHGQFMRMAALRLGGRDAQSLSQGDLVGEAVLRLMRSTTRWQDRQHFAATVALTMRSVLRERARARMAERRRADRVDLTMSQMPGDDLSMAEELLTLDALLGQFEAEDPRAAQVLELTYFAGLAREDVALVLDVSVPTVDRELRFARAWLSEKLGRHVGD